MIDVNDLKGSEIGMVEDLAGQSISNFGNDDKPQAKMMFALAYVIARRGGDKRAFKRFYDETTMTEAMALVGTDGEDAEDPKDG